MEFVCESEDNIVRIGIFFFFFENYGNIVGKGENADYKHFLLIPQYFQKPSSSGLCGKGQIMQCGNRFNQY